MLIADQRTQQPDPDHDQSSPGIARRRTAWV